MLAIKEKRKEGKGYILRIGLLIINLAIIMFGVQVCFWIKEADKNGAFHTDKRIGEEYLIHITEQIQGTIEIIVLVLALAILGIGCLFIYILWNKMCERRQLEWLLQCMGYRQMQIQWYEFCYLAWDCLISYIGAFLALWCILEYLEQSKIGGMIKQILKLDELARYQWLVPIAGILLLLAFGGTIRKFTKKS